MPTRVADASLVTLGRCSQHRTRVRASHARAAHASAAARPLCAPGRRYSRASTVRSSVRSSATEAETLSEERRRLERSLAASRLAVETMGERIVDAEQLRSTAKHRAIVASWWLLQAAVATEVGLQLFTGETTPLACAAATVLAYLAADLGSGVFHFFVDNYGDKRTPALGNIIDAFQGHHKWPRTIVQREFCNNVHGLCAPQLAPLLLLALVPLDAGLSAPMRAGLAVFAFFTAMSQQTHAWSHSLKSELPAAVVALQSAGLIISRKAHGAHHLPPFQGNYAIVSGVSNALLDAPWALPALERYIYETTGVGPRCWDEPPLDWVSSDAPDEE